MRTGKAPEPVAYADGHIIERPDGFYWQDKHNGNEYGPFATLREAEEDMAFGSESAGEDALTLDSAEEDIGIADWIDPDTGEPAEESIPHIDDN
jgi:hypothetical protein